MFRRLYPRRICRLAGFALLTTLTTLLTSPLTAQAQTRQPTKEVAGSGDPLPLYEQRVPESLPLIDFSDPEALHAFQEEVQRLERETEALLGEAEAIQPPPSPSPFVAPVPSLYQEERQAAESYAEGGEAPILALPNARSYPFGHATPEVVCVPQRVCDIELEAGERYIDHRAGDHLNWQIVPGPDLPDHLPDHLSLRPRQFGLHTNLVVYTTKRTYHLRLRSPEEEEGGSDQDRPTYAFDQSIRFYYPDDWAAQKAEERRRAAAEVQVPPSPLSEPLALTPGRLSADYTFKEPFSRSRRLPWKPVTVFDDGKRTFLALPDEARHMDLPVLLGRLATGETYPLNPTLRDGWWVVPTLFTEAELRIGTGRKSRWLRIIHTGRKGGR